MNDEITKKSPTKNFKDRGRVRKWIGDRLAGIFTVFLGLGEEKLAHVGQP